MRERSPGVWELRVYRGRDPVTKKQRYASSTIRGGKRQAQTELAKLVAKVQRMPAGAEVTLDYLLGQWLDVHGPDLSPTTLREYRRLVERHISPALGEKQLRKLRADQLDGFYRSLVADKGLSERSVKQVHAIIHRALSTAARWEWVGANVASAARPPKVTKREIKPPSSRQVRNVLTAAGKDDPELAVLLRVAAVTGARRGELCGLRWSDLEPPVLHVHRSIVLVYTDLHEKSTKTGRDRYVTLDDDTLALLARHAVNMAARAEYAGGSLQRDAFMFSRHPECREPLHPSFVSKSFRRYADAQGLHGTRLHDLRHAAATEMLNAGIPVNTVSARLGHSNASMTYDVYGHAIPATDGDAARAIGRLFSETKELDG
jgi:integrase